MPGGTSDLRRDVPRQLAVVCTITLVRHDGFAYTYACLDMLQPKRRKQQKGVVEPSNQNRVKKVGDARRCTQPRNLTR